MLDGVSDSTRRLVSDATILSYLADTLDERGYDVYVPAVRDGTVVARRWVTGDELPIGYETEQSAGSYRLVPTSSRSRFGWAVGPQPWKPLLHPPAVTTMSMTQTGAGQPVSVRVASRPSRPLALIGLRPCDLAAIDKLDRVLIEAPPTAEPTYVARRGDALLVVVNCGVPASTCFCTSMGTGPHVGGRSTSHDIEVTELVAVDAQGEPSYLVSAISVRGETVLDAVADRVEHLPVGDGDIEAERTNETAARHAIERRLDAGRAASTLRGAHDSRRWAEVAELCLACGNCTAVCPTCFCTAISDVGDLDGTHVDRRREWESCFSLEFSRLGSGSVRSSVAARYRQWMTHKLGTWHDQFGESGCVGCGRCTTWCPADIDFVDVVTAFVDDSERALR